MPDRQNLKVVRGDTKNLILTFKDAEDAVIDITAWTVWFTVKENIDDLDAAAKLQKKNTVGGHTDPTNGITTIVIAATDTEALATGTGIGTYVYDIQIKNAAAEIYTVLMGNFIVENDVTRSIT